MRIVFYEGQLMREGDNCDYSWDAKDRLVCHHPSMRDAGQIRIFDLPDAREAKMFEVALYEPSEEEKRQEECKHPVRLDSYPSRCKDCGKVFR